MEDIRIRVMAPEEKRTVRAMAYKAFPFLMRLFFSFTKHVLVAEYKERIVGAVVLKSFALRAGAKGGLISFIFSDPSAQGLGVGRHLANAGISSLEEQGCTEIFAVVEGYNTSSSRLFSTRGFFLASPYRQFRLFGFSVFSVWYHTSHLFDIGYFLWHKTQRPMPRDVSFQFPATLLLQFLAVYFVFLRSGSGLARDPLFLLYYALVLLLLFSFRFGAMGLVSRRAGIQMEYRMWDTGLLLNLFLSLAFGAFFTAPGSLYPKAKEWRYKDLVPLFGRMALVSNLLLIALSWGLKALRLSDPFPAYGEFIDAAYQIAIILAVVDSALPFFPFNCFNGSRVWDWNKALWAGTVALLLPQFFI